MADDASTSTAGATSNTAPPQSTKRNSPAKRTPAATTAAPASNKKSVPTATANKTPVVSGTKRNAAGTAKQGTNANGKAAAKDDNAVDDDEEDMKTSVNKKIKTSNADNKNGIKVFEDGSAAAAIVAKDEDEEGGVEYAA